MVNPSASILSLIPASTPQDNTVSASSSLRSDPGSTNDAMAFATTFQRSLNQRNADAAQKNGRPAARPPVHETQTKETSDETEETAPQETTAEPDKNENTPSEQHTADSPKQDTSPAPQTPQDPASPPPALAPIVAAAVLAPAPNPPAVVPAVTLPVASAPVIPTVTLPRNGLPGNSAVPVAPQPATTVSHNTPVATNVPTTPAPQTTVPKNAPVTPVTPGPTNLTQSANKPATPIPAIPTGSPMDSRVDVKTPTPGVEAPKTLTPQTPAPAVDHNPNLPATTPATAPIVTAPIVAANNANAPKPSVPVPQPPKTDVPITPVAPKETPVVSVATTETVAKPTSPAVQAEVVETPAAPLPKTTTEDANVPVVKTSAQEATRQRAQIERLITVGDLPTQAEETPAKSPAPQPTASHPLDVAALTALASPSRAVVKTAGPAIPAPVAAIATEPAEVTASPVSPLTAVGVSAVPTAVASNLTGTHSLAAKAEQADVLLRGDTPSTNSTTLTNAAVAAPQADTGAQTASEHGSQQRSTPESQQPATPVGAVATGRQTPTVTGTTSATPSITSTNTSVERTQIVEQVTRHLEAMRMANGRGEITMRLQPEQLGSVRLTISHQPEGVVARIVTETTQAQQAMHEGKEQLRAALEDKGLRLHSLEVSVGQNHLSRGNTAFSEAQSNAQEHAHFGRSYASGAATSDTEPETSEPSLSPTLGRQLNTTSRLDYRA